MFRMSSASRSKVFDRWPALRAAGAMFADLMFWPARFDDPQVEREFTIDYGRRFADFRRAALVLGTLIWACFGWWEINLAQSNEAFRPYFPEIFAFRCLGVLGASVGIVLAFRLRFDRDEIAHRILLTGLAFMCMCLLVQTILAPRPLNFTHFFVGFYLILFYLFGFLRLRAKATFLLTASVICVIVAAQLVTQSLEAGDFAAGMFYLLNVALVGYSVNVSEERHVRDRFVAVRLLARSNDALQGANAELAKKHRDLERARRDQQDRSDALVALREQQREDAEGASQAKSRFLAAAAHDLRQPMHALNLFLAAAGEALDKRNLDESIKLIGEARKASVLMAKLFNAVLDLSKLESGHVKPNYSCIDLDAVAQESIEQLMPFAESCGVKLRYRPRRAGQKKALVRSDADWAPRVLSNLVSNGIKYSDPAKAGRCTVIVGVVRMPNYVRVDVVDNGIGIASQHWDAIFQPFVQIGNPERDREKGLGLGLSIVNAVVSLLEGHRIELKSVVGRGSRFSVRLPAVELPAGCDAVAPLVELAPSRFLLQGLYVMLVEDDGLVRASMNALFVQWGVLCESARSLAEFETLLETAERLPDLLISDYRLPEFSTAHDVVRMLATRLTRPVPCLVITGETTATAAGRLPERYVLAKPISADELAARMVELTEGRRMEV